MGVDIIKVSSSGQIFLPTEIRKKLSIAGGDSLAIYASDKVVVLKPIKLPTEKEFSRWLDEAQTWAKDAGYVEEDVIGVTKSVRRKKRK